MTKFALASLLVAVVAACNDGGTTVTAASDPHDWYVSPSGSDANLGTQAAPFRTITHALAMSAAGESIRVLPGFYTGANGEVFPLFVPAGVELIGNESTKGADTVIRGGADVGISVCIRTGRDVTIGGFTITNDIVPAVGQVFAIEIRASFVRVRNCSLIDSTEHTGFGGSSAIYVADAGDSARILNNRFLNNAQAGLKFNGAGAGSELEGNEFRGNLVGIVFWRTGGGVDMGGGGGSAGGNIFSSNAAMDIDLVFQPFGQGPTTVDAQNCLWDHVPPSGNDIQNNDPGVWTVVTTGAQLAPEATP